MPSLRPTPPFAAAFAGFVALGLLAPGAGATPRPLPFTYPAETLPKGALEVEQYVDLVPVRVPREEAGGTKAVTSLRSELQTELEYGIAERLELGFYFAFQQGASATSPYLQFRGLKQRLRYELSEKPYWPLGVGLYGEIAEFHNELEFEEKLILSRRFGPVGIATNLWVEQEYYFQDDDWRFIYNPTFGAYYEFSPAFMLGAEYWFRGRFDHDSPTPGATSELPSTVRHYAGPTVMVEADKYFLSLGSYLRVDHLSKALPLGDPSGRVWFRLLVGVML
jgi:hypothetical protein